MVDISEITILLIYANIIANYYRYRNIKINDNIKSIIMFIIPINLEIFIIIIGVTIKSPGKHKGYMKYLDIRYDMQSNYT